MEFIYATTAHLNWLKEQDEHVSPAILLHKIQAQQILLAIVKGEPIGWLRFGFFWDTIPFMNLLFLHPAFRQKGIGSKLVKFWESEMQKQQHKLVMTSTQSDETAQHFYRKLGYVESGSLLFENEPLEIIFRKSLN